MTGTVTDFHTNDDGDSDIRLDVDPQYRTLLNAGNISNLNGHLQTEAICQTTPTTADSIQACSGFRGAVPVPSVAIEAKIVLVGANVSRAERGSLCSSTSWVRSTETIFTKPTQKATEDYVSGRFG